MLLKNTFYVIKNKEKLLEILKYDSWNKTFNRKFKVKENFHKVEWINQAAK